jgi:Transposase IS116/IS110/IS902 family/Transposase
MTPWLVHELRNLRLEVVCLDARHARAALEMQINKTGQNDAEGLAQIVRTGWYRSVHVKSFESHRARALLGARTQLVGMTTRLSNHIRGVLKRFGLLPGAMRGLPFDRKVEALILAHADVALIVRPMLVAWRQVREQIAVFDKAIRMLVRSNSACRLLMSIPGIGVLSALAYVSTVEDPARFSRSRSVGAHLGLTPRQYQSGEVDRSGRISVRRNTRSYSVVRGCYPYPVAGQESLELEGLGARSPSDRVMAKHVWRWLESSPLSCIGRAVSLGKSRVTPLFVDSSEQDCGCNGCPPGESRGGWKVGLERRHCMPARCGHCGTCASDQMLRRITPTAERTVTQGGDKIPLTKRNAIRERLLHPARERDGSGCRSGGSEEQGKT